MATTFTETTLSTTYKDDFRDSDNYHRILFNSGVGLQARELTQLQTILQTQIERFGNNIFKEGAVVEPGGANINPQYEFIKLDETDPSHVMPTDVTTLVGKTVEGQTSGIVATILEAVAAAGSDPATLYVKYTNTSSAQSASDVVTQRMSSNEIMDVSDGTDLKVKLSTLADPSTGKGTQITLLGGVYYARGNFVVTQNQSKIISKYSDTPTTDIGFKAVEEVVTASDNNALYDNQGTVPNVSAPGADRYRITLTIAERSEIGVNENFVHIATINNGQIFSAVDTNDSFNVPNKVIARRIFENSGNYIVKPFLINFAKDSQDTHLLLKVTDGTVVIDGFRASRNFPTTIRVPKPTATVSVNNEPTSVKFGMFVLVDHNTDGNTQGLPNINQLELMNLRSSTNHGGSTVGTARVRAISREGTNIRMHLIDINMNSGQAFRNVKSIGTSTDNYFNILLENAKAVIKEPFVNVGFFTLPKQRPQSLTDLIYTAQRKFTGKSANSSGVITLDGLTNPGETYVNQSEWVFAKADSDITTAAPTISLTGSNTGGTVDFGTTSDVATIASSSNLEYTAFVQKTQTSPKTKTLTTFNLTNTVESDGSGFKTINLKRADVFDIQQIVNATDSNEDYSNRFIFDNGQRTTHYDTGRLILKEGQAAPAGNVFVKYRFFEPSASGDYFSVNSYSGQVNYNEIPATIVPTDQGNILVNLRDVIDFRSVADSAGNFNTLGSTMLEMPRLEQTITSDVTYNLARSAKLVINRNSNLLLYQGNNAFYSTPPETPEGTLPLYDITLNPATLNDSDLTTSKYNFKRFTMRDIGKLEERVERLEEETALSLLEVDTKYSKVVDSAGNDRVKTGFFVDDFRDHSKTELSVVGGHRAGLDPSRHTTQPPTREEWIRMIYDSASSTNTIKRGDNVYLKYDEEPYVNQTTASKAVKINPFAVTIFDGVITLSPSSDEWRDVERRADKTVPGGTLLSPVPARYFDGHVWDWAGNTNRTAVNRVVTNESILTLFEDRTIESVLVPFMRSRKVFFKADGLRPNTRVFTFLDGNNITSLTNGTGGHSGFQFYSDTDSDFGNTLNGLTVHPDGSSTLVTDGDGRISGSFIVPNSDALRISTGTKQFKILDISVDDEANAGSVAYTPYSAQGFLDTKQAVYHSTRVQVTQGPIQFVDDGGGGGGDDDDRRTFTQGKLVDQVYDIDTPFITTALPPVTTPSWAHLGHVSIAKMVGIGGPNFSGRIGSLPGTGPFGGRFESKLGMDKQLEAVHSSNQNEHNDNTGLGGNIGTSGGSLGGLHT